MDAPSRATLVVAPVTLEGRLVRLEPLAERHLPDLIGAAADPTVWRWMPEENLAPAQVEAWLSRALGEAGRSQLPFATVEARTGRAMGSTRYLAIERQHLRLEIGWTWLTASARGRGLNDEAKLLMLRHAFEVLGCRRVEFKTDAKNERSRGALLGIGARYEGVFRKHMLSYGGRSRDSAWYSVLDDDWPDVEQHLIRRLAPHLAAGRT